MLKSTILVFKIISFKYNEHASKVVCKVEKEHKLNSNYLYRKCTRLPKKRSAKVQIDIRSYKML